MLWRFRLVRLFDPEHTGRFEYHRFAAQVYRHAGVRNVAIQPAQKDEVHSKPALTPTRSILDEHLEIHKNECELEPPITVGGRFNFDFNSPSSRIPEGGNILAHGSFERLQELESSAGELVEPPPSPPLRPGVVDKEAAVPMTTEMEVVKELDSNVNDQL